MELEQIDLVRLINQTLADMEEQINESGLTFRVNIPDEPVYMGRWEKTIPGLENLIANTQILSNRFPGIHRPDFRWKRVPVYY